MTPREITMDELLGKQRAMSEKAPRWRNEKDVERIQRITAELAAEGRELEALALAVREAGAGQGGAAAEGQARGGADERCSASASRS